MEYTRLIQVQLRHSELATEARIARLAKVGRPALRSRSDRSTGPSDRPTTTTNTPRLGTPSFSGSGSNSPAKGSTLRALALYATLMRCWYIQIEATSY
jgi:hypothetical protein